MNFIKTKITGLGTDFVFSKTETRQEYPLCSELLETVLRYISLTKNGSKPLEEIKHINVSRRIFRTTDNGDEILKNAIKEESAKETPSQILLFTGGTNADTLSVTLPGYVSLSQDPRPVAPFISARTKIATSIFVNKEEERVAIFARRFNDTWIEELCSVLFRMLPWLYDVKDDKVELTAEERKFFQSINKRDWDSLEQIVNSSCESINFEEMAEKRLLMGWGDAHKKSLITIKENRIKDLMDRIASQRTTLNQYYAELASENEILKGLQLTGGKDKDEFYNFFVAQKPLHLWKIESSGSSGKTMYFSIVETLENYDKDEFEACYENDGSYFWDEDYSDDEKRELFYNIFGKERGKFRVESVFALQDLTSLSPHGQRCGAYDNISLQHPHLIRYLCLGGNEDYIQQYMSDGNWDMAIEQAIQATKNLNFGDVTVLESMLDGLTDSVMENVKCVIADNGKEMTPREFLQYVKESK